jgi:MqsR (Motility quorum-sensing regulator) toxin of toxin-antitoxin system
LKGPTYDLEDIKAKVRVGYYSITFSAGTDALALGFDERDVVDCVLCVSESEFYKTMSSAAKSGFMQDVYRTSYDDVPIYLKLQLDRNRRAVVISFKRL